MARLCANENFPLPVVEHLRQLGHDVLIDPISIILESSKPGVAGALRGQHLPRAESLGENVYLGSLANL